jgi:hypothetical protein
MRRSAALASVPRAAIKPSTLHCWGSALPPRLLLD